jgi:hypothetical protein
VAQPADLMVRVNDQLFSEVFVVEELLTEHVSLALGVQQVSDVPVILPHEALVNLFNLPRK